MARKRGIIPKFASEAEEADWWYANREKIADDVVAASAAGEAKILTGEKLRERLSAAKARPITIRLAEADLALARQQAERKGLPYQTYIRSLLHETLVARALAARRSR